MDSLLFTGKLVRLEAKSAEADSAIMASWTRDSEYGRLRDSSPAGPRSSVRLREWLSEDLKDNVFPFALRALDDDRLLGTVDIEVNHWPHGEGWAGIDIGPRHEWGRGYGTDAMRVMLRYAFTELNLHRVTLNAFEYNPRAMRSYAKVGFVSEGRRRQMLQRDGRRWDVIHMGILRNDWQRIVSSESN